MGIDVKLSLTPEEFDLLRTCVRVAFQAAKEGYALRNALDLSPRRVKMLEEYLDSGQRPRHGVSV